MVGNLLAYRDDNHLTTTYTTWLSPLLGFQQENSDPGERSVVAWVTGQPAPEPFQVGLVLLGVGVMPGSVVLGHRTCRTLSLRLLLALDDLLGVLPSTTGV